MLCLLLVGYPRIPHEPSCYYLTIPSEISLEHSPSEILPCIPGLGAESCFTKTGTFAALHCAAKSSSHARFIGLSSKLSPLTPPIISQSIFSSHSLFKVIGPNNGSALTPRHLQSTSSSRGMRWSAKLWSVMEVIAIALSGNLPIFLESEASR